MRAGGRVRLGVIGAGRWGRNIIRTLRGMSAADLAWVASRNPTAREFAGRGCTVEEGWRGLLRRPGIDGIAIATPPALHAEMTAAAISAGLPVFVEKPLTCDVGEAERLLDLAAARRGYVLVDHVHLFSHAYRELKAGCRRSARSRASTRRRVRGDRFARTHRCCGTGGRTTPRSVSIYSARTSESSGSSASNGAASTARGERRSHSAPRPRGAGPIRPRSRSGSATCSMRSAAGCASKGRPGRCATTTARTQGSSSPDPAAEMNQIETPYAPPLECALAQFCANISVGRMSLDDLRFGVDVVRRLAAWDACLG